MYSRFFGGGDWLLIVGTDLSNSDWGFTLCWGPKEPDGITEPWRHVVRVNVRWPITINHRRPVSVPPPRPAQHHAP
jgi:hypothetical protein